MSPAQKPAGQKPAGKKPTPKPRRPAPVRTATKSSTLTDGSAEPRSLPVFWIALGVVLAIGIGIAIVSAGGDSPTKSTGTKGGPTRFEYGKVVVDGAALPAFPESGSDPAVGKPIPTVNGQNFSGEAVTIAPTGVARMIVFLAHWCPHCNSEAPRLADYLKQNAGVPAGVELTIVPTGSNEQQPNWPPSQWVKDMKLADLTTLVDTKGSLAARTFGLTSYPYIVMVDKDGDVVERRVSEQKDGFFKAAFKSLAEGRTIPANA